MPKVTRSWDMLTPEQRKLAIADIISFFSSERGEEIGVIAAEHVLDSVLQSAAQHIYNKGIDDAKDLLQKRLDEVYVDIEATLKK